MQIICISFQTNNHASTPSLNFLQSRCSSWCPTKSAKSTEGTADRQKPAVKKVSTQEVVEVSDCLCLRKGNFSVAISVTASNQHAVGAVPRIWFIVKCRRGQHVEHRRLTHILASMSIEFQRQIFQEPDLETIWTAHCLLAQPGETWIYLCMLMLLSY